MDSVWREIEELRGSSIAQLRVRYREVFQEEPRSKHREQLFRRLAWGLQARAEGGLSDALRERALTIARDVDVRVLPPRQSIAFRDLSSSSRGRSRFDRRIPRPGTVLNRNYRDAEVAVTVLANGFEYQGRRYGSLSAIAAEITGTRWNGLAFFGLTRVSRNGKGGRRG